MTNPKPSKISSKPYALLEVELPQPQKLDFLKKSNF